MKLVHFGEQAFYEKYTTSCGLQNLCETRGWDFELIDVEDSLYRDKFDTDSGVDIVTIHAAHLKIYRKTIKYLRLKFPNAKIITLGSDSVVYLYGWPNEGMLTHKDYEFNSPEESDLHLDTMSEVIEKYNSRGINVDKWEWTASSRHLDNLADKYKRVPLQDKTLDIYSLIAIKNPYRQNLKRVIESGSKSIIGPNEPDLNKVWESYRQSVLYLGTSSSSWTSNVRSTMKGYKDWIAPTLGTVVVYDDHPDVEDWPCLKYDYKNPQNVLGLLKFYKENPYHYNYELQDQQRWVRENTIEKQFSRLLKDHFGIK